VLRDLVGSPFYMAPEVLKRSYGKAADIWSCGVIMYILLCGSPPFYGSSTQQIFRAVLHDALDLASPPWDTVSAAAKDCVRRMLVRDPKRRATASEVLRHEWMRDNGAAQSERDLQPEILTRMKKFAGLNRLKKEALRVGWGGSRVACEGGFCRPRSSLVMDCHRSQPQVIATSLPPEEIEGIRAMFIEMDNDGSGTISFEELREGEGGGRGRFDRSKAICTNRQRNLNQHFLSLPPQPSHTRPAPQGRPHRRRRAPAPDGQRGPGRQQLPRLSGVSDGDGLPGQAGAAGADDVGVRAVSTRLLVPRCFIVSSCMTIWSGGDCWVFRPHCSPTHNYPTIISQL
jgi:serine/threonine protein kinase